MHHKEMCTGQAQRRPTKAATDFDSLVPLTARMGLVFFSYDINYTWNHWTYTWNHIIRL